MTGLADEQRQAVAAIEAAIGRGETFALQGLAGTGKDDRCAKIAASRPGAYLCALTGKAATDIIATGITVVAIGDPGQLANDQR